MKKLKKFEEQGWASDSDSPKLSESENDINIKIGFGRGNTGWKQNANELINRINLLVDFLDKNNDSNVSAGDVLGYICGWVDTTSPPEDEIEIINGSSEWKGHR